MAENYVLLETIELTQSAGSVTFDNIPQTGYTDLKIVMSARSNRADTDDIVLIRPNNSSDSLSYRALTGNGSSASSGTLNRLYIPANTFTANTFGNAEIYFPNYASSSYHSWSVDTVTENNGTTAYMAMMAGLRSETDAIASLVLLTVYGDGFVAGSTFSLYGLAAVGTEPEIAPKATGGNIVANDGTYWYHAFLSSGTFTPQTSLTCDYLVVAGGGGGGGGIFNNANGGGGGGAGGLRTFTSASLTNTNYSVTIGAGGAAGNTSTGLGANGTISTFNSSSASGGGGGGAETVVNNGGSGRGSNGGSGGGATGNVSFSASGNSGGYTPVEGYAGGLGTGGASGGGGGGAGGIGGNTYNNVISGVGGVGATSSLLNSMATATSTGQLSGGNYYYAGGGGGGTYEIGSGGTGGLGGGGNGNTERSFPGTGTAGRANTGGGGGGGNSATSTSGRDGYNGASGIVIIRYPMA